MARVLFALKANSCLLLAPSKGGGFRILFKEYKLLKIQSKTYTFYLTQLLLFRNLLFKWLGRNALDN